MTPAQYSWPGPLPPEGADLPWGGPAAGLL